MSIDGNEDDPILRMLKNRREEQEEMAKLRLEIKKQQLKSQEEIMALRIAAEKARQDKIRDSWSK